MMGYGMRKFTEDFKREAVRLVQTSGRTIDNGEKAMPIGRKCALSGVSVSVSGYYAWKSRRQLDDMVFLAHIRSQFSLSHETYGSPRMTVKLREDSIAVGRLMRENGLKAL